MRAFITGASGLIGRRLIQALLQRGDEPVLLTRRADALRNEPGLHGVQVVAGDPTIPGDWQTQIGSCHAVINLAGHNIFAERWNAAVKQKIRESRLRGTENVVAAIARAERPPQVLVSASAIGFYGPHGDELLTEESPPGNDFMALVCRDWEGAAVAAEPLGTRVVRVRIGIVLSRESGMLATLVPIFRWLPGGASPVGSEAGWLAPGTGPQWLSWIHLDDIVRMILLALDRADLSGPINGTAPRPVRYAEFARTLARVLRRPFLPFGPPNVLMRLVLGELADAATRGQRVIPSRATSLGFGFEFPELEAALRACLEPARVP